MLIARNLILINVCAILISQHINTKLDCMPQEPLTGIIWDKFEHDFGTVNEGELVETIYMVTNHRKDTLIIENVQGSCGCIVSKWPRQPILPGTNASIKVGFNSKGKSGVNSKTVTVYTNMGYFILRLKANVVQK